MPNLYAEFRKILAPSQQQVGEVVTYEDGIATILLPGGDRCWSCRRPSGRRG